MEHFNSSHQVPAASRGAARRRRMEGGRQHAVKIRLTEAEYADLITRAAAAKVSVQRFLVDRAMPAARAAAPPAALASELTALRRLTANLANNINQIARKLNSGGFPDSSIPPAADAVRRAMCRLDSALAVVGSRTPPGHPGTPRSGDPPSRTMPERDP